jgi:hypothetical protein
MTKLFSTPPLKGSRRIVRENRGLDDSLVIIDTKNGQILFQHFGAYALNLRNSQNLFANGFLKGRYIFFRRSHIDLIRDREALFVKGARSWRANSITDPS